MRTYVYCLIQKNILTEAGGGGVSKYQAGKNSTCKDPDQIKYDILKKTEIQLDNPLSSNFN